MTCEHKRVRCLNHYETFRKYLCEDCGRIFICACERELALAFLPHQVNFGTEYGTRKRYPVAGFAPRICAECRGELEEPHPRAAIYGQKGKVERFYWREISNSYYGYVRNWLREADAQVRDILEFERRFPEEANRLKKKAKRYWQTVHRQSPKYDIKERTEAEFLDATSVQVREIEAEYTQVDRDGQKVGKWIDASGNLTGAEGIATQYYKSKGYRVLPCERTFVSVWVATFLADVIQDTDDPRVRVVYRQSTRGWTSRSGGTRLIAINLPEDFGSADYYIRRREALEEAIGGMRVARDLESLFDQLLKASESLRDYLWVNDDAAVARTRLALSVIPNEMVIASVQWAIQDFWHRQPGWPDLFLYKGQEYLFSEVKSPHDKLSREQMNWFQWAVEDVGIPCEVCRVKRKRNLSLPKG